MTTWLASIVGVVVVGVIVELMTHHGRMGPFVRSIYAFIVLFVIVSPLPKMLKTDWWATDTDNLINTELVDNFAQSSKQQQVTQKLRTLGYENALVTVFDHVVYVNLGVTVDEATLSTLQQTLGEGVVIV